MVHDEEHQVLWEDRLEEVHASVVTNQGIERLFTKAQFTPSMLFESREFVPEEQLVFHVIPKLGPLYSVQPFMTRIQFNYNITMWFDL